MAILHPQITPVDILNLFPGYFKEMLSAESTHPEHEKKQAIDNASQHLDSFIDTIVQPYFEHGGSTMDNVDFARIEKNSVRFVADLSLTLAQIRNKNVLGKSGFLWVMVWTSVEKESLAVGDKRLADLSKLSSRAITNTIHAMLTTSKA